MSPKNLSIYMQHTGSYLLLFCLAIVLYFSIIDSSSVNAEQTPKIFFQESPLSPLTSPIQPIEGNRVTDETAQESPSTQTQSTIPPPEQNEQSTGDNATSSEQSNPQNVGAADENTAPSTEQESVKLAPVEIDGPIVIGSTGEQISLVLLGAVALGIVAVIGAIVGRHRQE